MKIKALTYKEKQMVVKGVIDKYRGSKVKLQCLEMNSYYPQLQYDVVREKHATYYSNTLEKLHSRIDEKDELRVMIDTFEIIIQSLSQESKEIIELDFINNVNQDWWMETYSRSSYYRAKTRAMEEFIFYLSI